MKKTSVFLLVALIFTISSSFAQAPSSSPELTKFLSKNLRYPTDLRQANVEGPVIIMIQIDPKGDMTGEYQFLSGDPAFKNEMARTVKILKENWDSSFLDDKNYNQEYLMSFQFKLSKGQEFSPNPFTKTSKELKPISPLETVNLAITNNPFSPTLYEQRAEIFKSKGNSMLAEMDQNQAQFLKNKFITEIVIVGFPTYGPKSL